jgi:hypothetical protein
MSLLPLHTRTSAALVAVGDPSRDRTVYASIVLLVALGFTMIMLAVWLLRNTRPDPEVLAPLERMGQRKWRRADPVWQRRRLDEVRPGGADPLEPMSAPPATDAEFERGPQPIGFDDLVVSSETTAAAAAASELPAPVAGAVVLDGPVDVDTDVEAGVVAAADQSTTGAPEPADDVETAEAPADDDDADGDTAGDGDDDDEDITGEQDTDDFLAVLDQVYELDPDVEPDAEPEVTGEAEPEPVGVAADVEPETEPDVEPEVAKEPETEAVGETDVESDSDPVGEADVESDSDPVADADVESETDPVDDADDESEADPAADPDVDERDESG